MDSDPDSDDDLCKTVVEKLTHYTELVAENAKLQEEVKLLRAQRPLSGKIKICLLNGNFVDMEIRIGSVKDCIIGAIEKFKEKNIHINEPIEKINIVVKGVRYTKDCIITRDTIKDAVENSKIHLLI